VKKILIFCLYCVVFTLIPAASILAQGGKDNLKDKPFPVPEAPEDEGETYFLSPMMDDDDESSFAPETTVVNEGELPVTPEATVVNEANLPVTPEVTVINENTPSPVPKKSDVSDENRGIDKNSYGSAGPNTTVSAAESAAASAVTATPHQPPPSQPQPPAVQPQSAPSRLPPQPPVRTIAPTVNIIVPSAAPPAAPPAPAYRPSINVTPGMPDPNSNGVYRVQVGAFSNTGNAQQCFNRLKSAGFTPFYEQYGNLYRVVLTGIQAADMTGVIRRLEAAGFTDAWIREER